MRYHSIVAGERRRVKHGLWFADSRTAGREGCAPEFLKLYWQERLKARRVFNDPAQVEKIVELLEPLAKE
jgi:hypothetical protein